MSKPEPVDNPGGSDEPRKQLALIMWSGLKYYPERRIWELTDDDINNIMNKVLPYLRAHHKPQPTADAGELRESFNQYVLWMLVHLKRKLKVETTDLQNKLIESQAAMMAAELYRRSQEHFQHQADQLRRECEAEVVAARKELKERMLGLTDVGCQCYLVPSQCMCARPLAIVRKRIEDL